MKGLRRHRLETIARAETARQARTGKAPVPSLIRLDGQVNMFDD